MKQKFKKNMMLREIGFTLVELLVVVAIMVIAVAVIAPKVMERMNTPAPSSFSPIPDNSGFPQPVSTAAGALSQSRGRWISESGDQGVVKTLEDKDYTWQSFNFAPTGAIDDNVGANRVVIFRLEGNPDVSISAISDGRIVDTRLAEGRTDNNGQIGITLSAPAGAANAEPSDGKLWGIVPETNGSGVYAQFEVTTP
ncbi:MAG: prepilin-type N-terminal cleavage/methylation domain-containing protein [Candidatus Scalindua sp.]